MERLNRAKTRALIAALILLFLTSCASPRLPTNHVPAAMLEPCGAPELNGDTYADVIRFANRQRQALEECNVRLRAIKKLTTEDTQK